MPIQIFITSLEPKPYANFLPPIDTLQSTPLFDSANIVRFWVRIPGDWASVQCCWACFRRTLSDGKAKFKLHSDVDIEPEIDRRNVLFMCAVNQQILACYYIWRIACFR